MIAWLLFRRKRALRRDILIATIYLLGGAGGRKVSMSEVMDAVKRIQEHLPLGYAFWDRFLYSPDLADDLRNLDPLYVRRIIYQHDGYLPRYCLRLTAPGRDYARRVLERLQRDVVEIIEKETAETIKNFKEAWKLLERPTL
jgi:hypothetical protein